MISSKKRLKRGVKEAYDISRGSNSSLIFNRVFLQELMRLKRMRAARQNNFSLCSFQPVPARNTIAFGLATNSHLNVEPHLQNKGRVHVIEGVDVEDVGS